MANSRSENKQVREDPLSELGVSKGIFYGILIGTAIWAVLLSAVYYMVVY